MRITLLSDYSIHEFISGLAIIKFPTKVEHWLSLIVDNLKRLLLKKKESILGKPLNL